MMIATIMLNSDIACPTNSRSLTRPKYTMGFGATCKNPMDDSNLLADDSVFDMKSLFHN